MKTFIKEVLPHIKNFETISIFNRDIEEMKRIILNSLNLKDEFALNDRLEGISFLNNFLDKALPVRALEKKLKSRLIDWPKVNPKNFEPKVILGDLCIDIYTSHYGSLPKIPINNHRGAIITIRKKNQDIIVCGYASKQILNSFQKSSYLTGVVGNNNKTVFIGFNSLVRFKSIEELRKYHIKLEI